MFQKKKPSLLIVLLLFCTYCIAQEYSAYQGYYFNPFLVNPAVTGAESYPVADFSVRQQWLGFTDAPVTYQVSGYCRLGAYDFYDPKGLVNKGPVKLRDRIGIGAAIYRDISGPSNNTGGLISYAYHFRISPRTNLGLGLAAAGEYYAFNSSILRPDMPNDDYLLNGNDNEFNLNFNFGAYLYHRNYFVGISADKILPDISQVNEDKSFHPGYFIIGGCKLRPESTSFDIEPSVAIMKIGNESLAVDFHTKFYIKGLNWVAVSYSTSRNLNFQFGLRLYKMIYLGYRYGTNIGEVARYSYGSHEIHLGVNLGMIMAEGIYRTARQVDNE